MILANDATRSIEPEKLSILEWLRILRPSHVKAIVSAGAAIAAASYSLGGFVSGIETRDERRKNSELVKRVDDLTARGLELEKKAIDADRSIAVLKNELADARGKLISTRTARSNVTSAPMALPLPDVASMPSSVSTTHPSKFSGHRGAPNLPGYWRGEFTDGQFVVEVKFGNETDYVATFSMPNINCRAVFKITNATDDQLTTSNFFFKPTTMGATCPAFESMMLRPFETICDLRITKGDGRTIEARLYRKV